MDWKNISLKLLIPFAIVFLLCLYGVKSLSEKIGCEECFISKFGLVTIFVVGLLSLASSVPTILAIKKEWKSTYTLLIIFIFLVMVTISLVIGEGFFRPVDSL